MPFFVAVANFVVLVAWVDVWQCSWIRLDQWTNAGLCVVPNWWYVYQSSRLGILCQAYMSVIWASCKRAHPGVHLYSLLLESLGMLMQMHVWEAIACTSNEIRLESSTRKANAKLAQLHIVCMLSTKEKSCSIADHPAHICRCWYSDGILIAPCCHYISTMSHPWRQASLVTNVPCLSALEHKQRLLLLQSA